MFPQDGSRGIWTRATLKAHSTLHPPPSPLRNVMGLFLRLMLFRADKSAVCAINRHLLYCLPPSTPPSLRYIVSVTRNARPFGEGLDGVSKGHDVGETGGCRWW